MKLILISQGVLDHLSISSWNELLDCAINRRIQSMEGRERKPFKLWITLKTWGFRIHIFLKKENLKNYKLHRKVCDIRHCDLIRKFPKKPIRK